MRSCLRTCIVLLLLGVGGHASAQSWASSLEAKLSGTTGLERLDVLQQLAYEYQQIGDRKARRYGKQANTLADNLIRSNSDFEANEQRLIVTSKLVYADILYDRKSYLEAREIFREALAAAENWSDTEGVGAANAGLADIDSVSLAGGFKENFFNRTLSNIDIGSAISNSASNVSTSSELKLGQIYEKRGDTVTAILHYEKAAELLRKRGDITEAEEVELKIETFREMHRLDSIRSEYFANRDSTTELFAARIREDTTGIIVRPPMNTPLDLENKDQLSSLREMAQRSEAERDYEASLNYYKAYLALQEKYQSDSATRATALSLAESRMEVLRQQNEIADLSIQAIQKEKEAEEDLKNLLMVVAGIVTVGILFVIGMYISRLKKHRQLTVAYADLDKANVQLEEAEEHISTLLKQQVSPEIASALIDKKPQRKRQFVAVMFLDIRGFTPKAEKMDPEELIEYQNSVFGFMIEIIRSRGGNVNQFMGDGFMSTFGAPVSHGNDPRNAFLAAQEILQGMAELNKTGKIPETKVGIGIHAGYVVTGNVGTESRKQYSVTGNTVIIAARVEQLNKDHQSQLIITQEVRDALEPDDVDKSLPTLEVNVKGRKKPVVITVIPDNVTASVND